MAEYITENEGDDDVHLQIECIIALFKHYYAKDTFFSAVNPTPIHIIICREQGQRSWTVICDCSVGKNNSKLRICPVIYYLSEFRIKPEAAIH